MRGRFLALLLTWLALHANPATAHPIPRDSHDRTITIHLTPEAVLIEYHLEVDEIVAAADLRRSGESSSASGSDRHTAYLHHYRPEIEGSLRVDLDGRELDLECTEERSRLGEHVYCTWRFRARWRLGGQTHRFRFFEGNFPRESNWCVRMTLSSSPDLTLTDEVVPGGQTTSDRARRTILATVQALPSRAAGVVRMGLPPPSDPVRPGARGRSCRWVASAKPVPPRFYGAARTPPEEQERSHENPASLVHLLFDDRGVLFLLVVAAGFGAVHALLPGHGKTVLAAFLIGQRGTVWHAILLGLVTAFTHSVVVLGFAAVLPLLLATSRTAEMRSALEFVGGLLLAGLGLYLLIQRLAGRPDHVHLGGACSHHEPVNPVPLPLWNLIVLGVSGGLVPCWDAIALLMLAISTHRLWLGLPLLLAFSAGLAVVLVGFGIVVVRSGDLIRARSGRLTRLLSIVAALLILVVGLWLCVAGIRQAA